MPFRRPPWRSFPLPATVACSSDSTELCFTRQVSSVLTFCKLLSTEHTITGTDFRCCSRSVSAVPSLFGSLLISSKEKEMRSHGLKLDVGCPMNPRQFQVAVKLPKSPTNGVYERYECPTVLATTVFPCLSGLFSLVMKSLCPLFLEFVVDRKRY